MKMNSLLHSHTFYIQAGLSRCRCVVLPFFSLKFSIFFGTAAHKRDLHIDNVVAYMR